MRGRAWKVLGARSCRVASSVAYLFPFTLGEPLVLWLAVPRARFGACRTLDTTLSYITDTAQLLTRQNLHPCSGATRATLAARYAPRLPLQAAAFSPLVSRMKAAAQHRVARRPACDREGKRHGR